MRSIKLAAAGLVICALAALGASTAETRLASAARYVDPVQGFSIAPPPSVQPIKERAVVASFPVGVDDEFVSNINIIVDPIKTTRKEYVEASLQQLNANRPKVQPKVQEITVSGKEAVLVDFDATMPAARRSLHFLQLVVIDSDRVYIVTCTAPTDFFAAHEAEFKKCIDSFHLE